MNGPGIGGGLGPADELVALGAYQQGTGRGFGFFGFDQRAAVGAGLFEGHGAHRLMHSAISNVKNQRGALFARAVRDMTRGALETGRVQ